MSAGEIWRRDDGLEWVEIQAEAVDPSGWRIMVPLAEPDDAHEAPPLVVAADGRLARVHLMTTAPATGLGRRIGELSPQKLDDLRHAAQTLVNGSR